MKWLFEGVVWFVVAAVVGLIAAAVFVGGVVPVV